MNWLYNCLLLLLLVQQIAGQAITISTLAGTGVNQMSNDGGPAVQATLVNPSGVGVDTTGNLYISEQTGARVRKVTSGIIYTTAGNTQAGYSGDGGAGPAATLNRPNELAIDTSGNVYIADTYNCRIRKVTVSTGIITTVAGIGSCIFSGDGGVAPAAAINSPYGVAVDSSGNVYISDTYNCRIRKVSGSTTIISTIAGSGSCPSGGDGGQATSAGLQPFGVAVDYSGNFYSAEYNNNRVRKVTVSTGIISTVAGTGTASYSGDNIQAVSSGLNCPIGVAVDYSGNLYISDTGNNRIRVVTVSTGIITTIAGTGIAGFSGDNGAATSATLNGPWGIRLDSTGNIYFADINNQRVRKIAVPPPTALPTAIPTPKPSLVPTAIPSTVPTRTPTSLPSFTPSDLPTALPTVLPSITPTAKPSIIPTIMPSQPTRVPTIGPSYAPTNAPSFTPSVLPSTLPTRSPSAIPSFSPSTEPSALPTRTPTSLPSFTPSDLPTALPSVIPTFTPSAAPSVGPTMNPSLTPTESPTPVPSTQSPSVTPSDSPTTTPTTPAPTSTPSSYPSSLPSSQPTSLPTSSPTQLDIIGVNLFNTPINAEVVQVKVKFFLAKYVIYFLFVFMVLSLLDYSKAGKRTSKLLHDSAFSSNVHIPTPTTGLGQASSRKEATEVFYKLRKKDGEVQEVMERHNKLQNLVVADASEEEAEEEGNRAKKLLKGKSSNRFLVKETAYSQGFYRYLDQKRTYLGCEPLLYRDGVVRLGGCAVAACELGAVEDLLVFLYNSHSVLSCIFACDGAPVDRLAYRLIYITQNCIAFFMSAISSCVFNYLLLPTQANIVFDILVTTPATIAISKVIKALYTCPVGFSVDYQVRNPLVIALIQCLGKMILVPLVFAILFLLLLAALFSQGHDYAKTLVYFFLQVQLYGFFLELIFSCLLFVSRFYMRCTIDLTWRSIVLLEVGRRYTELIYHNSLEDGKDYHYRCYYLLCLLRIECIYQYDDAVKKGYITKNVPVDVEMTAPYAGYECKSESDNGINQVYMTEDTSRNSSFFTYDTYGRDSVIGSSAAEISGGESAKITNPLHQAKTAVIARMNTVRVIGEVSPETDSAESRVSSQCRESTGVIAGVIGGSEEQSNETDEEYVLRKKAFRPETSSTFIEVFRKFEESEQLASSAVPSSNNDRTNFMHSVFKKSNSNILGSKR